VLGIAAVAVALLLVWLNGRGDTPTVTVTRVTRQAIESWISTNGKVEPIHPHILRARLDTFVLQVAVIASQQVKREQLLVQLDATGIEAQLAAARQSLLTARRQLQYAEAGGPPVELAQLQSELTKTQAQQASLSAQQKALETLVAEHAATPSELRQIQLQLKQTEAQLDYLQQKKRDLAQQAHFDARQARLLIAQAQAQIKDLSEKVASTRMVAPIDGTVYSLPVKVGDFVRTGDPVVSVADLRHVRVLAYVDEADLGSVSPNQPVQVQWDGLPGETWTGVTTEIPKQVVPYGPRRVGDVLCSINSYQGRLLPNTNVDVRIRVGRSASALVIPRAAVQGQINDHYVFLVRGGRLRRQPIKVGIASTSEFQVLEGLKAGERVALPGATLLKGGMQVHPVEVQ
jgi:HlyD family secretion protein